MNKPTTLGIQQLSEAPYEQLAQIETIYSTLVTERFDIPKTAQLPWDSLEFSLPVLLDIPQVSGLTAALIPSLLQSEDLLMIQNTLIGVTVQQLTLAEKLAICILTRLKFLAHQSGALRNEVLYKKLRLQLAILCPANLRCVPLFAMI